MTARDDTSFRATPPAWPDAVFTTRTGQSVVLRVVHEDDIEALIDVDEAVVRDGHGVVRSEEDLPENRRKLPERIREWVERSGTDAGIMIVAEVESDGARRVVGDALARRFESSLIRHGALVAVQVHPDWQGHGLGRALMERVLDWCRATDGVRRIELVMRGDNYRARALYESLGFTIEGVRRGFIRMPDGTEIDDTLMSMRLDRPS